MGLFQTKPITQNEINYIRHLRIKCDASNMNQYQLLNIFRSEYNIIIEKWNNGTIRGHDFTPCTTIISYINNDVMRMDYNTIVTKYNNGELSSKELTQFSLKLKLWLKVA